MTSYINSIPGHHEVYSNIIRGRYCDVLILVYMYNMNIVYHNVLTISTGCDSVRLFLNVSIEKTASG